MASPSNTPRSLTSNVLEWAGLVLLAVAIAWVIVTFVVQVFAVPSGSMEPTIMPGDRLLVAKFLYSIGDPKRGDIAVFHNWNAGEPDLIKRVIGAPGDTIDITSEGSFTLNGKALDEPYLGLDARKTGPGTTQFPVTLGPGEYWMMGDNRNNSGDSRYNGVVARRTMVGKALFTFWPFEDAKIL